jgi:hypothetical protein
VQEWDEEDYEDEVTAEKEELIGYNKKLRGSVRSKNSS